MVTDNKVVALDYTLKDDDGNVLDASKGDPLHYLHGHQNIVPGLERELTGLKVGDKKQIKVSAEDGYGSYDDKLRFRVPAERFSGRPEVDMMVELRDRSGQGMVARVAEVGPEGVVLDANHPLAGRNLNFEVEIKEVRDATSDELDHGHAHGPGGHHH